MMVSQSSAVRREIFIVLQHFSVFFAGAKAPRFRSCEVRLIEPVLSINISCLRH